MKALILANGDPPPPCFLRSLIANHSLVLVTDGAAQYIPLDLLDAATIIGDFDSIADHLRKQFKPGNVVHDSNQENSDLEKAITHALEFGCNEIIIAGATGSRMDHTLTAFSLLVKYHKRCPIRILTRDGWAQAVSDKLAWSAKCGERVSLILFEPAVGVNLRGVEWPLTNEDLLPGSRTVSNEVSGNWAELTLDSGVVILVVTDREVT